jgi:hypothetical protein
MKLVSSLSGTLAIIVSPDEASPPIGVMANDLIDFVAKLYNFSVKPTIPDGVPPSSIPVRVFQSGFIFKDDIKMPIFQLGLFLNGYIVTAATTDVAEIILNDLLDKLDAELGFQNGRARKQMIYQSNLSIQFSYAFEALIEQLKIIEEILDKGIARPQMPFKIKRLAFGYGDPVDPNIPMTMETLRAGDFTIERRASEPYVENRYFCSAPMRTTDHAKILEAIEDRLRNPQRGTN